MGQSKDLIKGTIIDGKYKIIEKIGSGGISNVYLAFDTRLNKQWDIKVLEKSVEKEGFCSGAILSEANLISKLDHPSLARIVDIIDNGKEIFVVMDYVEGESLDKILANFGPQPEEVVVDWAKQICDVLSYLHTLKPAIIYRDVKPHNMVLTPDGKIKILDFSIAKIYDPNALCDETALGTFGYAPPEQYGGLTDARSDIFALGMTMHQLLTGVKPQNHSYKSLRDINPKFSKNLDRIIDKCVELDPEKRYQTCEALMEDLNKYKEVCTHKFECIRADTGGITEYICRKCGEIKVVDPFNWQPGDEEPLPESLKKDLDASLSAFMNRSVSANVAEYSQTDEVIPGWEIVEPIGGGGFGKVYKIRKTGSADTGEYLAALKVVNIPQTPDEYNSYISEGYDHDTITNIFQSQLNKLVSEFQLMSKMKGNSHIVSYEDHTVIENEDGKGWKIFIKMELLTPLSKIDTITVEDVVNLGIDICKALEVCKKQNIIHRDIKPQNIFVNDFGDFKLGDFGIARVMDHATSATRIGTYTYMAPEVYHGQAYDESIDVYSLGLVLYWLLNEKRMPFVSLPPSSPSHDEIEEAHHNRLTGKDIPHPKNGSKELKDIVLKACAYSATDRYASASDMRKALEKVRSSLTEDEGTTVLTTCVEEELSATTVELETTNGTILIENEQAPKANSADLDAKALAFLETGMDMFANSSCQDGVALNIILTALSDAPLYFPVEIDLDAMLGSVDPTKLKPGDTLQSNGDVKMCVLTLSAESGIEFVPMFTSREEANKGPSASIIRYYPQDYLPMLMQMGKPALINPFSADRFILSEELYMDVLLPLVQSKTEPKTEIGIEPQVEPKTVVETELKIEPKIDRKTELVEQPTGKSNTESTLYLFDLTKKELIAAAVLFVIFVLISLDVAFSLAMALLFLATIAFVRKVLRFLKKVYKLYKEKKKK